MKTVMCLGKFDVLHTGHLYHLKEAKKYGDYLVVVITADPYLPEPPVFTQDIRKQTLELLPWVDEVYICNDKTGLPAIDKFKPNFLIKGSDYLNGDKVLDIEKEKVESFGGALVIIDPDVVYSSTKLRNQNGPFLNLKIELNQSVIRRFIEDCSNLYVGIIGEPIIDIFQKVILDGQSAKSYCPSFTTQEDEITQLGGAHYVLRHVQNFCKKYNMFPNYKMHAVIKKRFLDYHNGQKHLEIKYKHKINIDEALFKQMLHEISSNTELLLIADFGHGLFDNKELVDNIYLMVQTNSSNFGYNKANKWNKYKSKLVCLDRTEASLLLGWQIEKFDKELMNTIYQKLNTEAVILTMHKYGSVYFDKNDCYVEFPALAVNNIVDSIGAGDAFFTIASLAYYLQYKPEEVLFLASLAAAANTQHLCTQDALTPFVMKKMGKAIL